jgi:hypothetical protein
MQPLNSFEFQDIPLTVDETAAILYMREEEKLARDIYSVFHEFWSTEPRSIFSNIAQSEQRHGDALNSLIIHYKLSNPVIPIIGKFTDQKLQNLYQQLLITGQTSIIAALEVGAQLEEIDIIDLNELLQHSKNQNIQAVYQELMQGSHDHLRAFVHQLKLHNISYTPQKLQPIEFDKIIQAVSPRNTAAPVQKIVLTTRR